MYFELPSKQREGSNVIIVDIALLAFNALSAGTEDFVPHARLLAIVVAFLPASAMVQVVVLERQFHAKVAEKT